MDFQEIEVLDIREILILESLREMKASFRNLREMKANSRNLREM